MGEREDLSGRTLGEFVVRERIGEGGFGAVDRCEQPLLGREAWLASRLDDPYAAHVYAFGIERDDGLFWIAMERVVEVPCSGRDSPDGATDVQ